MNNETHMILVRVVNQINPALYRQRIYDMIMADKEFVKELETSSSIRKSVQRWGEQKNLF